MNRTRAGAAAKRVRGRERKARGCASVSAQARAVGGAAGGAAGDAGARGYMDGGKGEGAWG